MVPQWHGDNSYSFLMLFNNLSIGFVFNVYNNTIVHIKHIQDYAIISLI